MGPQFLAHIYGPLAMLALAVLVTPRLTDDDRIVSWVVVTVGIVAVGQLLGALAASVQARHVDKVSRREFEEAGRGLSDR